MFITRLVLKLSLSIFVFKLTTQWTKVASKLPNNVLVCILLLIKINNSFMVLLFGRVYSYLSFIRKYKIINCAGFVKFFLRSFVTIRLINSHKIKQYTIFAIVADIRYCNCCLSIVYL